MFETRTLRCAWFWYQETFLRKSILGNIREIYEKSSKWVFFELPWLLHPIQGSESKHSAPGGAIRLQGGPGVRLSCWWEV